MCQLLHGYLPKEQQYLAVADLVLNKKLYKEWDQEFDVPVFDDDMVVDYMEPYM